ncbi:MAG: DUF973 family protein [Nitrososphaerota archaeon]|jgi:hypothetical protein|nr:DUF973 family protein [Nitrososphaerota archaeon]MDG6928284.1 DUF973 family protein [Nitrososphaerota archaeon]MDG6931565.1 DUF973 family protein [Nitrososphaerota archaeon]MDG6935824.1 DUF973 family protein [Nitrososphaerota archaeon]MDG6943483.1 DUF973 family protein [Nitrososphaerota archaeon]
MQNNAKLISKGARMLMWSMLVAVIGSVVSGIVLVYMLLIKLIPYLSFSSNYYINSTSYLNTTSTLPPSTVPTLISGIAGVLYIVIGIAVVFGVVELVFQWMGWSSLKTADSRYAIGRRGLILVVVGAVFALVSFMALLPELTSAVLQGSSALTSVLPLIAGIGILSFVGAILIIVGVIMLYIGLWRLGSSYNNRMIKVSIILVIVDVVLSAIFGVLLPAVTSVASLLGIASTILLIIGLHRVSAAASSQATSNASEVSPQ